MILKAKPCFNFQSVEFEAEINNNQDWEEFLRWYSRIYKALQKIAPEDVGKSGKKPQPKKPMQDPATEAQISIMEKHGIEIPPNCTRKRASKLIEESITKAKEEADEPEWDDDDDDMPF